MTENIKQIEMLAFVFVKALDLNIEDRIDVRIDTDRMKNQIAEILLVGSLDRHEAFLKFAIVGKFLKILQPSQITLPARTDLFRDQLGKPRIAGAQPAARDRKSTRLNSSHVAISYA